MRIRIEEEIPAQRKEVWTALSDLGSHSAWMKDAREIEFLGESRSGVGTRMRVPTGVGPLRTWDIVEITGWIEGESISASHRGVVRGTGQFRLDGQGPTVVIWEESLRFPWWLGGPITAIAARPILKRIWVGNLRRFATRFSEK